MPRRVSRLCTKGEEGEEGGEREEKGHDDDVDAMASVDVALARVISILLMRL
jgi:hypothetical protein